MVGAALVVIAVVIVLPSLLFLSGAAVAFVLGTALKSNGEAVHAESELLELNR